MSRLKLEPDDLHVESFTTVAERWALGTVFAHAEGAEKRTGTPTDCGSCGASCELTECDTCGDSCEVTKCENCPPDRKA